MERLRSTKLPQGEINRVLDYYYQEVIPQACEYVHLYCGDVEKMPDIWPVTLWKLDTFSGIQMPQAIKNVWENVTLPALCSPCYPCGVKSVNQERFRFYLSHAEIPRTWGVLALKNKNADSAKWFEDRYREEFIYFNLNYLNYCGYGLVFEFSSKDSAEAIQTWEYPKHIQSRLPKFLVD
jgi:hypothetical protein